MKQNRENSISCPTPDCLSQIQPTLLSAQDLAICLGISLRQVYRLQSQNKLPAPVKIGQSTRWTLQDINNWIEQQKEPIALLPPFNYHQSKLAYHIPLNSHMVEDRVYQNFNSPSLHEP